MTTRANTERLTGIVIAAMQRSDWERVRAIYLDGIGKLDDVWRDTLLLERRSALFRT